MRYCMLLCSVLFGPLFLSACSTERYIKPTLSGEPRVNLRLKEPVLGAVYDGRAIREPEDAADILQGELERLYGPAIEWVDYFEPVPSGKVGIRIRIVTLGATFGSRLISGTAYASAMQTAHANAVGPWGILTTESSNYQAMSSGAVVGEGWWNGAAWIDIEIQDKRFDGYTNFVIPIVSESRQSNVWGYSSGDKAAHTAWNRANEQLTRTLDNALMIVRETE